MECQLLEKLFLEEHAFPQKDPDFIDDWMPKQLAAIHLLLVKQAVDDAYDILVCSFVLCYLKQLCVFPQDQLICNVELPAHGVHLLGKECCILSFLPILTFIAILRRHRFVVGVLLCAEPQFLNLQALPIFIKHVLHMEFLSYSLRLTSSLTFFMSPLSS